MSTPKLTKFRAIITLEAAVIDMIAMKFTDADIKEIVRDVLRQDAHRRSNGIPAENKANS